MKYNQHAYETAFKEIEKELDELNIIYSEQRNWTSLELERHDLLSVAYEALENLIGFMGFR